MTSYQSFAATLFSKDRKLVRVVRGVSIRTVPVDRSCRRQYRRHRPDVEADWLSEATIRSDENGQVKLAANAAQCDALLEPLGLLTSRESVVAARQLAEDKPARMLHLSLAAAPLVRRLETVLWEKPRLRLNSLAAELWGSDVPRSETATIELLRLSAAARQSIDEQPLVPHRLHVLTRLPSEMRACLNPDCNGPASLRWAGLASSPKLGLKSVPTVNL